MKEAVLHWPAYPLTFASRRTASKRMIVAMAKTVKYAGSVVWAWARSIPAASAGGSLA